MPRLRIKGGKKLKGSVKISGAKNAVLPLLAAAILCDGESVFYNCPELTDVDNAILILRHLGIDVSFESGVIKVNGRTPVNTEIPENMMRKMRSSVIFLGSILARRGKATVSAPGGCELGPRPIDLHISSLKKLGAEMSEEYGKFIFTAPDGLCGTEIDLSIRSVGATENLILASVLANGRTVINNAAREPEIEDLIKYLNNAGADISGSGTGTLVINGVKSLKGTSHRVIPDRIEAVTFMSAAAVTGGNIILESVCSEHLKSVTDTFVKLGCDIQTGDNYLRITAPKRIKGISHIKSLSYPEFPTDAGPLTVAVLSSAKGNSVFVEGVFKNRYRYIEELKRMGADIITEENIAIINGKKKLHGAYCVCTDLRGGAALAVAALGAQGITNLGNTVLIKRGYEKFEEKLRGLGAEITEV